MTVTVGAGTTLVELDGALAEHAQECGIDAASPAAAFGRETIGGVLASGLSGHRRLRLGPLRDRVLEVRFVTGDARVVRGGGPTVKNVTGYDIPRLLVGSLGTLGVLTQVTLRTQPRPECSQWTRAMGLPGPMFAAVHRPACLAWDGRHTWVLLEGHRSDVEAQARAAALEAVTDPPPWPTGTHRGRISVVPQAVEALGAQLATLDVAWIAEAGVGTVHVAAATEAALATARSAATEAGGWLLREAGAPGIDPFGRPLPNLAVMRRIKYALDPSGKLNPGRLPFVSAVA